MNNQTKLSVMAVVKEKFVALRKKYGIKNPYSMTEIAQQAGLPVKHLENAPSNYEGYMDWHDEPRFIAVNRALPAHERALFIARQLALRVHQRRFNSLAFNRPWKWVMLDAAPEKLKQEISQLDIEHRAHCLMLFFATGDEFRAFIKADPKRIWFHAFTDNIVGYHLSKLRIRLWFSKFCRKIAIVAFPAS
jgi:hypothetical protein